MKNQIDKTNIGAGLLAYRIENNLTREEIASKIGVSAMSIYRWEQGKAMPKSKYMLRQIKKLQRTA